MCSLHSTIYAGTKNGIFSLNFDSDEKIWKDFGLTGQHVTTLYLMDDVLYAGTAGGGVFRKDVCQGWWSRNWQTLIGVGASVVGLASGSLGTFFYLKKCFRGGAETGEGYEPLVDDQVL